MRMTEKQRAVLAALGARERSNAQVAEMADISEAYASKVLAALARQGLATSRVAQDARDPQTHYRLWRRA